MGNSPILYYLYKNGLNYHCRLRVITAFGDDAVCRDTRSLIAYWDQGNTELTRDAVLPEGMLQFDVIATTDR